MCGTMICVAAVMLGIDVGWQPMPEGGLEYTIQIQPHMLETLKDGVPITSDIPPGLKDVRSYRIMVGSGKLPRESLPEAPPDGSSDPLLRTPGGAAEEPSASAALSESPPGRVPDKLFPNPAVKPLKERQAAYVEPTVDEKEAEAPQSGGKRATAGESSKPWLPLTLALVGLFGSLGCNVYLGWIHLGTRRRYRELLRESQVAAVEPPTDTLPQAASAVVDSSSSSSTSSGSSS